MKSTLRFIAYAILAGVLLAAAIAHAGEPHTVDVSCWKSEHIAKAVEAKRFRVMRYWNVDFMKGDGLLAQIINPKDGQIMFFVIQGELACLVAVTDSDKPQTMVQK